MKEKEPLTIWDRFAVLYAAEGLLLPECYERLKAEGYPTGQWRQFQGRYWKMNKERKSELDKAHLEARRLRESLECIDSVLLKTSMQIFLRYKNQLDEAKEITYEQTQNVIRMASEIMSLTPKHPKYNIRQDINIRRQSAEILSMPASQIFYISAMQFEPMKKILEDKIHNRKFVEILTNNTKKVMKGELLLESAPDIIKGKAIDAEEA